MIRRTSIALAVLACCAAPAHAANGVDPPSSSYLEAAYLNSHTELDFGTSKLEDDQEGFRGALSVGLMPYLNFYGDVEQERYAESHETFSSAGLVGHTMGRSWQAFGGVTYERHEYDDNRFNAADYGEDGYGVLAGGRIVVPLAEFHAAARYLQYNDAFVDVAFGGFRYGAGLTLDLTSWWSLVADYNVRRLKYEPETASSFDANYDSWSVGIRRYFATQSDPHDRKGGVWSMMFPGGNE